MSDVCPMGTIPGKDDDTVLILHAGNFFPAHDPEQGNHNNKNQKNMDKAAHGIGREYSDEPQGRQNQSDGQQHRPLLSVLI
jgi:hypothetical protein